MHGCKEVNNVHRLVTLLHTERGPAATTATTHAGPRQKAEAATMLAPNWRRTRHRLRRRATGRWRPIGASLALSAWPVEPGAQRGPYMSHPTWHHNSRRYEQLPHPIASPAALHTTGGRCCCGLGATTDNGTWFDAPLALATSPWRPERAPLSQAKLRRRLETQSPVGAKRLPRSPPPASPQALVNRGHRQT